MRSRPRRCRARGATRRRTPRRRRTSRCGTRPRDTSRRSSRVRSGGRSGRRTSAAPRHAGGSRHRPLRTRSLRARQSTAPTSRVGCDRWRHPSTDRHSETRLARRRTCGRCRTCGRSPLRRPTLRLGSRPGQIEPRLQTALRRRARASRARGGSRAAAGMETRLRGPRKPPRRAGPRGRPRNDAAKSRRWREIVSAPRRGSGVALNVSASGHGRRSRFRTLLARDGRCSGTGGHRPHSSEPPAHTHPARLDARVRPARLGRRSGARDDECRVRPLLLRLEDFLDRSGCYQTLTRRRPRPVPALRRGTHRGRGRRWGSRFARLRPILKSTRHT